MFDFEKPVTVNEVYAYTQALEMLVLDLLKAHVENHPDPAGFAVEFHKKYVNRCKELIPFQLLEERTEADRQAVEAFEMCLKGKSWQVRMAAGLKP
ncbi:MAG: hypothetical protein H6851_05295 [Geminicoccaceae bacterium]|nr:hypothetical protein [Geminicoccaceae bacterium]